MYSKIFLFSAFTYYCKNFIRILRRFYTHSYFKFSKFHFILV